MTALPLRILCVLLVGLALHNIVMAHLWEAGVRGRALDVVSAWKEALLLVAAGLALAVVVRARRLPFRVLWSDRLALAYALVVAVYAVVPQSVLGGEADGEAVAFALRHDLTPVAAYLVGRVLVVSLARVYPVLVGAAAAVAVFGIIEVYAVSLEYWRDSGAPGWFREQLGLEYEGLSGLPENFVFNTGDETELTRRLVSTFLSPLATAFMLVVTLVLVAARRRWAWVAVPIALALLLTHARSAILVLAGALVVLAAVRRVWWPVAAAAATVAAGVALVAVFPDVAPDARFTAEELRYQREQARGEEDTEHGGLEASEPSLRSHLTSLRDGVETVVEHPLGFGLGNAGVIASRFDVDPKAGESSYTELGVEIGVLGLALFVGWLVAMFVRLARGVRDDVDAAGLAAALAAVAALGLQTDVYGVPWLAYCLFWLLGSAISRTSAAGAVAGARY